MEDPPNDEKEDDSEGDPSGVDPELLERQRLFGDALRAEYTKVTQEETPDAFLSLLDDLEAKERTR